MLFHCFLHCYFVLFVNNSLLVFPWWVLFVFVPWNWSLCTWNSSAMMRWPVLAWERRVHQISGFAYSNYRTLWCRITLLYLLFSHNFFDLIKNSCYCSIDVALLCHLYIYILTNSLFILSNCLPLPLYGQTAYHCCLPEKSTRENKLLWVSPKIQLQTHFS